MGGCVLPTEAGCSRETQRVLVRWRKDVAGAVVQAEDQQGAHHSCLWQLTVAWAGEAVEGDQQ